MELCDVNEIPRLEDEEWKRLVTELYPGIAPYYFISNKGRQIFQKNMISIEFNDYRQLDIRNCRNT